MLKERKNLETIVKRSIKKIITDKNAVNNKMNVLISEYGLDERVALDIALMKKEIETCDDKLLYIVAKAYGVGVVESYYTLKELKDYSKKIDKKAFKFPIKWQMTQVNEDQYIGTISVQDLMMLRDAQLINYNENAQRSMKKVVEGNDIIYQISLNKKAVDGIKSSFKMNTYIPNTITLNIPIDGNYYYDGEYLVIEDLEHFDILDGYHRYIAMSELYNLDREFDYKMELRVVSFTDEKARQFIWQEDQKTKMKKIDSDSFNQNTYSNQLIGMLNESPLLRGLFNVHGIINSALANRMVDITFFHQNRKYTRKELLDVKKYILERFELITEEHPEILDSEWDNVYTISFFYSIWKLEDADNLYDVINKIYGLSQSDEYKYLFTNKSYKYSDVRRLDKVVEELHYV